MTDKWNTTDEADEFIASGDSRETSPAIMRAIAFFAHDLAEAEAIWAEPEATGACTITDIWEHATSNGARGDGSDLCWGAAGTCWMAACLMDATAISRNPGRRLTR